VKRRRVVDGVEGEVGDDGTCFTISGNFDARAGQPTGWDRLPRHRAQSNRNSLEYSHLGFSETIYKNVIIPPQYQRSKHSQPNILSSFLNNNSIALTN
jgi:hypothetical protein